MFHVILFEPEIPPNTGNVIRLCANTGATLHLVQPLGFDLDDARVKRAGLDYHELAQVHQHVARDLPRRAWRQRGCSRWRRAGGPRYDEVRYAAGDAFLFGRETTGCRRSGLPPGPRDRWFACRWCRATAASISRTRSPSSCSKPGGSSASPEADEAH